MLHADLLNIIEANAREYPDSPVFFDAENGYKHVTFKQLRTRALRLVLALEEHGVQRGGACAVDLENSAAFVYLLIAAAYGGFSVVALNTRLTVTEKKERARELYHYLHTDSLPRLDEETIMNLLAEREAIAAEAARNPHVAAGKTGDGQEGDVNVLARVAQRGFAGADDRATAVVMFTSGTQGRPKAANLTWQNLLGAAAAANARLCTTGMGRWQVALPMYHVGGLAIVLRCLLNGSDFILYRHFDPYTLLRDARHFDVTHVSLVDKMLQDLLDLQAQAEEENSMPELGKLSLYECILLGGAAPNTETLKRAQNAQAAVQVTYGLTETSSCAATIPAGDGYDGFVSPLPGYQFAVLDPDENGLGQLAVKGPGVFEGYLNAQATFTPDGFFLTGDAARTRGHRVHVAERSEDMFVSGGENIYPQEIRDKLCSVPGVTEAFVFSVEHATWGRRPVALIEANSELPADPIQASDQVRASLENRLSRVYIPDHIMVLDELPRTPLGKIDRRMCKKIWDERVQVESVELWRIKLPMKHPIRTAKGTLRDREVLLLRITDAAGRAGLGECAAFSTDWYLPETISSCEQYLENTLLPELLHRPFLHPRDTAAFIGQALGAANHPLACATVEMALWDAYGKATARSIRALIGGRSRVTEAGAIHKIPSGYVPGGAVIGISSAKDAVSRVEKLVDQGYTRVKIKVQPGRDIKTVAAVRKAFPDLTIALDANQSYKDTQIDRLREMDAYDIVFIEEPLRADWHPRVGPQGLFERLARVQEELSTQVCLDESWHTVSQLKEALEQHPELRCVCVKIAKFGGIQGSLDFYDWARERGIQMVIGGMFETGIAKRALAAFCTLPGVLLPGDLTASSRYFSNDICDPPLVLEDGILRINPEGHEYGLGCDLNEAEVTKLLQTQ